jgi:hypothetical protein
MDIPTVRTMTTFGVKIPSTGELKLIARRKCGNNGSETWFVEKVYELLPDNLQVIAIDNSNQGILNIKDIKNQIRK